MLEPHQRVLIDNPTVNKLTKYHERVLENLIDKGSADVKNAALQQATLEYLGKLKSIQNMK